MTAAVQTPARALTVNPLFLVPDVVKAAEHYRDRLGFRILNYYGDPPCFVFVRRDRVDLMLKQAASPDQVRPNGAHGVWDAYVWVDDFDAIRGELAARGARVVAESPATSYGTREIEVEDGNGYRLCFAQDTSQGE
jgi:catechol 2,3-dioxygenase-like lactoylglutathione lyase family enzyme